MNEIQNLKARLNREKGQRDVLLQQKQDAEKGKESLEKRLEAITKARAFLQNVARATQSKLEFHISSLVTTALQSVFEDGYDFNAQFVERRNKTECDLFFSRNGTGIPPLDSSGGGPIDVASFALRLAFWSLKKTRPIIILDEPFKFVSSNLHEQVSLMLKQLSSKLGVQIIMISHLPDIISAADKVIKIENGAVVQ